MPYEWTPERMNYWRKTKLLYDLGRFKDISTIRKALLVAQGFKCACCGCNLSGKTAYLDHAHNSGEIRGVLCLWCNRFRVAKNSRDTAIEVVRYLNDPPAGKLLPPILDNIRKAKGRLSCMEQNGLNGDSNGSNEI